MTPDEIKEEKQEAMNSAELQATRDRIAKLYDYCIEARKTFEKACTKSEWDEGEAEQRLGFLVFGMGDEGSSSDQSATGVNPSGNDGGVDALKSAKEDLMKFYDLAIDMRRSFERAAESERWNLVEAEHRCAWVIFGAGDDEETDAGALGL